MRKDNYAIASVAGGAILAIGYLLALLIINDKKHKKELVKKDLEINLLKSKVFNLLNELNKLKKKIDGAPEIDNAIKNKLKELINNYEDIDERVASELNEALQLIKDGHHKKANFSLIKIIENLLKEKYIENTEFEKWHKNKNVVFKDLIDYGKKCGDLDKDEYLHLIALKETRNQEAHGIGIEKDENIIVSTTIMSFSFICKISNKFKNKLNLRKSDTCLKQNIH